MATQTTRFDAVNNAADGVENIRKAINYTNYTLHFMKTMGERKPKRPGLLAFENDVNVQTPITTAEWHGQKAETDVIDAADSPVQIYNQFVTIGKRITIAEEAMNAAVVDGYGKIAFQVNQQRMRYYKAIEDNALGNVGSVKLTSSVDPVVGSLMTFAGNGNETLADNPGLRHAGDGQTSLTNAGGYDSTTEVTSAIVDNTASGNKGPLTVDDIVAAASDLQKNINGARLAPDGSMRKDATVFAYIPIDSFTELNRGGQTGISNLSRSYMHEIGGNKLQMMTQVARLTYDGGTIMLLPHTSRMRSPGTTSAPIATVAIAGCSGIVWNSKLRAKELNATVVSDQHGLVGVYTLVGPSSAEVVNIVGLQGALLDEVA